MMTSTEKGMMEVEINGYLNMLAVSTIYTKTIIKLDAYRIIQMGRETYTALMRYIQDRVRYYGLYAMSYKDAQGNTEIVVNRYK